VIHIGTQFGLIYFGWATACGVSLAVIAFRDFLTIKSPVPGTAVQPADTVA
jgi:hypothetical protein